jgi:4a-hydroxytetrahydrobiopterin dehydratase
MADASNTTGEDGPLPARLDPEAVARLSGELPAWTVEGGRLVRTVVFGGYLAVLAFLERMAPVAERLSHHPDVIWQYDRLEIAITTHDVGGLTRLDAELARQVERLLDS